jgi:hypothetical protein
VTIGRPTISIADAERRVDTVVEAARRQAQGAPAPILLAVDPTTDDNVGQVHIQIDAMLAAQRLGWPTINGYSGNFPPGVTLDARCANAARQFGQYEWQRQRRGGRDRLGDDAAALKRIVFVGGDCDSDPLNRVLVPVTSQGRGAEP